MQLKFRRVEEVEEVEEVEGVEGVEEFWGIIYHKLKQTS
jgi:hypothetical protein